MSNDTGRTEGNWLIGQFIDCTEKFFKLTGAVGAGQDQFGKKEKAEEDQFFRRQQQEQLKEITSPTLKNISIFLSSNSWIVLAKDLIAIVLIKEETTLRQ